MTLDVGDRVRVKDVNAADFGLKPGTEGTVRAVGPTAMPDDPFGRILMETFYQKFPVEVEWDGEDYTTFLHNPKPDVRVYDRVAENEVEKVQ